MLFSLCNPISGLNNNVKARAKVNEVWWGVGGLMLAVL